MIKRINKITSIIIAAVLVTSAAGTVQVKAATFTYPRIETKAGSIYEAVAYKDGKFYIDGETEDVKNDGYYYLDGDKYTEINDIDLETDTNETYLDKYLETNDHDYYLDMSNGEISEGSSMEEGTDYAAIALRKKIRNKVKDRYSDHNELKDLTEIPRMKFGESWYNTNYDGYTVFSDSKGNYIDADYNLGEIKVETTSGSVVTLKNTEDGKKGTKASVSDSDVLGQDADYIYRTLKVTIESDEEISKIDGIDVKSGDAFDTSENDGKRVSFLAVQKISKEQAEDKIGGANYAKKTVTYILSGTDGTSVSLLDDAQITVAGGYIVEYIKDSRTITIQTISLYEERNNQNYVYANNIDKEEIEDMDIDVNGNLWEAKDGFVYKFDNYSEWNKVYRIDKGMDRLSVYDDNHMIIWSEDNDIYSIKADKSDEAAEETKSEETLSSRFGWFTNDDGSKNYIDGEDAKTVGWLYNTNKWYYFNASGIMQTGWIEDNNRWYHLNKSGTMEAGWINDEGKWYYLSESGAMKTGWLEDNGKWYFLNTSGEMLHDTEVDGYKLGSNGEWI